MPTIITRGAISARGYGFGSSSGSVVVPFPNSHYQYAFGGPYTTFTGTNRFYVSGTLKFCQAGVACNGCGSVSASAKNIMSFGFYYGNYSPHMFDNETGTRKDASATYGGWYSVPYVAISSKSIIMYSQGGIFGNTLWRSTDGGVTYSSSTPFTGAYLVAMHAKGETVFVVTKNGGATANFYYYISTDSGATWSSSGFSGLPTAGSAGSSYYGISFSIYSNGKHNLWLRSSATGSGFDYYTSTNGTSWTFQGNVANSSMNFGADQVVWYYNGYYYWQNSGYSFQSEAGYRSSDGYTWATFGTKPTFPGFGTSRLTATSSGLVMSYAGYCCSGTRYSPTIYTANTFSPTGTGCWTTAYTYTYATTGPMLHGVRGYNQDEPS